MPSEATVFLKYINISIGQKAYEQGNADFMKKAKKGKRATEPILMLAENINY